MGGSGFVNTSKSVTDNHLCRKFANVCKDSLHTRTVQTKYLFMPPYPAADPPAKNIQYTNLQGVFSHENLEDTLKVTL